MKNTELELKLRVSLLKAIKNWNDDNNDLINDYLNIFWGYETHIKMADAALNIIMAIKDSQDYIENETDCFDDTKKFIKQKK